MSNDLRYFASKEENVHLEDLLFSLWGGLCMNASSWTFEEGKQIVKAAKLCGMQKLAEDFCEKWNSGPKYPDANAPDPTRKLTWE